MQYVLLGLYEWSSLFSVSWIPQRPPCHSGFILIAQYSKTLLFFLLLASGFQLFLSNYSFFITRSLPSFGITKNAPSFHLFLAIESFDSLFSLGFHHFPSSLRNPKKFQFFFFWFG
ncbi:hypothetical protein CsSME_00049796 [Camellia sinensis var. sinensis]